MIHRCVLCKYPAGTVKLVHLTWQDGFRGSPPVLSYNPNNDGPLLCMDCIEGIKALQLDCFVPRFNADGSVEIPF